MVVWSLGMMVLWVGITIMLWTIAYRLFLNG